MHATTQSKSSATQKQLALIATLQQERNLPVTDESSLTKIQASELITALMDLPKPEQSLLAMAQAIETGAPIQAPAAPAEDGDLESQPAIMLAFDREECKALRSAISVCIGETDGSAMDHALYARIDAFLGA
jgi:hypothetical protein